MSESENRGGKVVGIITIIVLVIAGLVGGWYWFLYKPEQEAKEKARLAQIAKEKAEKEAAELAEEQKAKYEQLILDADQAFDEENWTTAKSLYTDASGLFPNETHPQERLTSITAKLEELEAIETRKVEGVVGTVSSRTGRFYVVVSSSIDDDLAMDYARKLLEEGNLVKIIPLQGDQLVYHSVSVGDYETREEAEEAISMFSQLNNEAWVLEY